MQYLRYLKQFFQIMFKIENAQEIPKQIEESDEEKSESDERLDDDEDDDDEQLRTGSPKILLTAVGIGYHNLTKTLV